MQIENVKQTQRDPLSDNLPGTKNRYIIATLALIALSAGLYVMSRHNYPLFHSLVDMITVFIAASVFVVVWNRRHLLDNHYYLYVGIGFLFFAFLDFMHLLGNKNMGVFPQYGNLGPTLYIASRYVLSISLVLAPLFIKRKFNATLVMAAYALVTTLIMLSIFYWQNFPVTYVEGVGLTAFKVDSDYIICLILAGAIGLLYIHRRMFDPKVFRTIVYSLILSIATGLAFTLYSDPFGINNAVGHFFQIASFYLVYIAFVETVFTKPQDILYLNLKQSKEEVLKLNTELKKVNFDLKQDIAGRKNAEEALKINNERLRILSRANSLLLSSEDPEKIVQTIASEVMVHLNCDCFFNFIADQNAGKLRLNAYAGIPSETAQGIAWLDYGVAICGCAARDGCRIISENIQENGDARAALVRSFGVQAYACHPLIIGFDTIGTLSFGTRSRTSFREDELDLMKTIAAQVSIAMERKLNEEYLKRYAAELETTNKELEAFSYSVSHDLRAPLRTMDGFSEAVVADYADKLDETGKDYLNRVRKASQTMAQLIDDILKLSRISRAEMRQERVDLSSLAKSIMEELQGTYPRKQAEIIIAPELSVTGDLNLLRIALKNLLENAWKFTGRCPLTRIEVGITQKDNVLAYFVKDNGIGFDMQYKDKLFQPFKRLHDNKDYPGTGIGLATVQRIIQRHNGHIWAESVVDQGTTFYFTLG